MVIRALLVLTLVLALGCKGKASKITEHEGARQTVDDTHDVKVDAQSVIMAKYSARMQTSERINAASTAVGALEIARELEALVLNPGVLADPNQSGLSEFDVVLSQFNRALNKAIELDEAAVIKSGILERYEQQVTAGCQMNGRGCLNLGVFRGDHLTSRILTRIAANLEPQMKAMRDSKSTTRLYPLTQRYYQLLSFAYELSNGQPVPELDQLYVANARDYFGYFRSLNEEQRQPENHRRFRDALTLALGHLRNQAAGSGKLNERYCAFLIQLNPLDPEMFKTMDLDKRSQRSMLSEFIQCTSQDNDPNHDLTKMVHEFVAKSNQQAVELYKKHHSEAEPARFKPYSGGYSYALESMKETPFMPANLGIELTSRDDMAFFVLERVFYQEMDLTDAMGYWTRIKGLDDLKFMKFVHNYARLQTAYVLKITMQNFNKVLKDQFAQKGGLSSDFFYEVVKELNQISQFDWDELRDRLAFTREFLLKVYDQRLMRGVKKEDLALQKEYLSIKESLGALQDHLAMAVTTPMTVPLYYYMAKAQGTIKFHVPWASTDQWFDIPATDALAQFLTSYKLTTYPFFKFGAMDQSWDELQKLHMLNYAFRIGVFEFIDFSMLDEDKKSGLPGEVLFFKQAIKDILKTWEYTFTTQIEALNAHVRNGNFDQSFLESCRDPLGMPVSTDLRGLSMGTFLLNPAMTNATSVVYGNSKFIPAWRNYRDNIRQVTEVMEQFLNQENAQVHMSGAKFKVRQQIVDQVRGEIEYYNRLERQFFRLQFEQDRKIVDHQRDCLERLHQNEFLRREKLMARHIEYFKDVHAAMSLVNGTAQTDKDITDRQDRLRAETTELVVKGMPLEQALNEVLSIHNVTASPYDKIGFFINDFEDTFEKTGKRIKMLNIFNGERFYQGRWDTLIRTRSYLNSTTVSTAEVNSELGTSYAGDRVALAPNTKIPLGTFSELEMSGDYLNNTQKNVNYVKDQSAFVRSAMIQMAGAETGGSQFISWYSDGGLSINLAERRLAWLKDLQELGIIQTSDDDVKNCPKDKWGRPRAVRDLSGRWLPGAPHLEKCQAYRVSSSDVMESYMSVLNLLRVSDYERELLDLIDRPGKMEARIKAYLQYNNEPSTTKWTYFDQFYRSNYTTFSATIRDGRSWKQVLLEDIRAKSEFISFKDSYQRNVENAPALFPLDVQPTQIDRSEIRRQILDHLNDIMEFEESVYILEESKRDLGQMLIEKTTTPRAEETRVFNNWRVMTVKTRTDSTKHTGTPIYLSEDNSAKSWFAGFVEAFVMKDTDCMVLPQKGDPDFEEGLQSPDMTCKQRLDQWKARREADRLIIRSQLGGK